MIKKLKVLLFDIETSPNLAYVWGKYEQDVIRFVKERDLLCYSWKWEGEKNIGYISLQSCKGNQKKLAKLLWNLFDTADIIIAHNGDQFDIKVAQAIFAHYGFPPPSPYKTIDTKKIAKGAFRFNSNKLDDLGEYLGLGRKIQTGGFDLWEGCMKGDEKSWDKMIKYNIQDVRLLEKVYIKLRPWMKSKVGISIIRENCSCCGSNKIQYRGDYITNSEGKVIIRKRYQCQDCGKWRIGQIKTIKK